MTRRLIVGCLAVALSCVATITLGAGSDVADAAAKGDKAALRTLIAKKADVNAPQTDGATALHWAVQRDDAEMTEILLRAGANAKVKNRIGISPLYMAALYGNPAIIEQLVKAGADVQEKGGSGETTLMLAARNGNPQAIKILLAAGADVNARETVRGTTALMWAVEQHHPAAVKALLEGGADFNLRSGGAGNPRNYMSGTVGNNQAGAQTARLRLCIAANGGPSIEEQAKIGGGRGTVAPVEGPCAQFAARGGGRGGGGGGGFNQAAPFGANNNNQGAAAAEGGANAAAGGQAAAPGGQAAAAGGQGQGQGRGGQGRGGQGRGGQGQGRGGQQGQGGAAANPAQAAAAQPAQPEAEDEGPVAGLVGGGGGGLTALILAAREGDLESAKLLLDAGANINQTSNAGWTPLLIATNNRNYILGKYLMERGADVNMANGTGFTPLYLASDNRNIEGGDFPVPKPDMDHLEYIKLILDRGANPNARAGGNTETRTIFTMQWFFEAGATPFVRASQSGDTALMKLLLAHGADPKLAANSGDTALAAAAGMGWVPGVTYEWSPQETLEAVRLLLDLGLDPNSANVDGRTPLMAAALKGASPVVQLLVDRGADLDKRDKGSRDTVNANAVMAGHTWRAVDYSDGLVRVGVQSAVSHPETGRLIRRLMEERGLKDIPPADRTIDSICIVEICRERQPDFLQEQR
jgi:ankyrin repeat protein